SVDPNPGGARSGTIVVGTQTFSVFQDGLACTYSLAPQSFSRGSAADSGSFAITAQAGCGWTSSSAYGWIHTGTGGSGNGIVFYWIDTNQGTSPRSGSISVGGQTFTVYQAGGGCSYTMGGASSSMSSGGGNGSVTLTAAAGCSWAVGNPNNW